MNDAAVRIAAAHADTADLTPFGDWALVSGVPCQHVALPHPWATTGRVLALPTLPGADTLAHVSTWLEARSPQWTLMVRAEDEPKVDGFRRWDLMPVLVLRSQPTSRPRPLAEIGLTRDREEFLIPYGAELAPVVTDAHLAAKHMHHLVARVAASQWAARGSG